MNVQSSDMGFRMIVRTCEEICRLPCYSSMHYMQAPSMGSQHSTRTLPLTLKGSQQPRCGTPVQGARSQSLLPLQQIDRLATVLIGADNYAQAVTMTTEQRVSQELAKCWKRHAFFLACPTDGLAHVLLMALQVYNTLAAEVQERAPFGHRQATSTTTSCSSTTSLLRLSLQYIVT